MVFSSLIFLFRFLPAVLILYYAVPGKFKNTVLFLSSLIFYAWGEPVYVCLMLFSTVVDYFHGLIVDHFLNTGHKVRARAAVISSAAINLALLGFFKYGDFVIQSAGQLLGMDLPLLNLPLPVGISFYTFQTMSYTIDIYRRQAPVQKNIIDFGCYVSMFPQLIAGPIVRYQSIAGQLKKRSFSIELFSEGIVSFTIGMGKKVLLANNAGLLWDCISRGEYGTDVLSAWLGIAAFGFQIYFDFSGYSDMALGLGKMLGFVFPENFNYPYISKSVTEFWRRWHISLGQWFREYVYIPLGGNRKNAVRNILIVWILTGLWHGAQVQFILWGLYYGIFLLIEKFVLKSFIVRWPLWFQHIYTLVIVGFGWLIFAAGDLTSLLETVKTMFGMNSQTVSGGGFYLLYTNLILLVVMIAGATPVPSKLICRWMTFLNAKRLFIIKILFMIAAGALIWVLSLAYLVDDTYNPFLYFRF